MSTKEDAFYDAVLEEKPEQVQALFKELPLDQIKKDNTEFYCNIMYCAMKVLSDAQVDVKTIVEYYELALAVFDDYALAETLIEMYMHYLDDQKALRTVLKKLNHYIKHVEYKSRAYYRFHQWKGNFLFVNSYAKKAIETLKFALNGFIQLAESSQQDLRLEIFETYFYIGKCYYDLDAFKDSIRYMHEAYTLGKKITTMDSSNKFYFLLVINIIFHNLRRLDQPLELKAWYERHQKTFESAVKDRPKTHGSRWATMTADYANVVSEDNPGKALKLYFRCLELLKGSCKEDDKMDTLKLSEIYEKIARTYEKQDQTQDAIESYKKSLEALNTYDEDRACKSDLHEKIYELCYKIGDYGSALKSMEALWEACEARRGSSDAYRVKQSDAAQACARALFALDHTSQGINMMRDSIASLINVHHKVGGYDEKLLGLLDEYVKVLKANDYVDELEGIYKVTQGFYHRMVQAKPSEYRLRFINFTMDYAQFFAKKNKQKEAIKLGEKALNMIEKIYRDEPEKYRKAMFEMVDCYASLYATPLEKDVIKIQHRKVQLYGILLSVDTTVASTYIDLVIDSAQRLYRQGAYKASHQYLDRVNDEHQRFMTPYDKVKWQQLKLLTGMHFEDEATTCKRAKTYFDFFDSLKKPKKDSIVCMKEGIESLEKHVPNLSSDLKAWIARFSQQYRRIIL